MFEHPHGSPAVVNFFLQNFMALFVTRSHNFTVSSIVHKNFVSNILVMEIFIAQMKWWNFQSQRNLRQLTTWPAVITSASSQSLHMFKEQNLWNKDSFLSREYYIEVWIKECLKYIPRTIQWSISGSTICHLLKLLLIFCLKVMLPICKLIAVFQLSWMEGGLDFNEMSKLHMTRFLLTIF